MSLFTLPLLHPKTCHWQVFVPGLITGQPVFSFCEKRNRKRKGATPIAIYHFENKIITRGNGRSAVAAAAYMSCAKIYNEYDGITHDYTKKEGLVWEQIFLPDHAPEQWKNRKNLWNAVEEAEKTKDSRLAREMIVALPIELEKDAWIDLLTGFIQEQFISEGMCADAAIHDTDGHNPHAHILLTVRPLNQDGTWQNKSEKEYLCKRSGEEKGFIASEFREAVNEGWEKQYQYWVGKKKVYMTPTEASARKLERVSKYPKSTKFGRQNPIAERWNRDEQLKIWREAWAEASNRALERHGQEERIDHRNYADQGLDIKPTIHEGIAGRIQEKNGFRSDRCELNREIRNDNTLILSLKEEIGKLTEILKNILRQVVLSIEGFRRRFFAASYHEYEMQDMAESTHIAAEKIDRDMKPYQELNDRIRSIRALKSAAEYQLENTPIIHLRERSRLKAAVAEYDNQISLLEDRRKALLQDFLKKGYQDPNQTREESKCLKEREQDYRKQAKQFSDQAVSDARDYDLEMLRAIQEYSPEELWEYLKPEQEKTDNMVAEKFVSRKINSGAMKQAKDDLKEHLPAFSREELIALKELILEEQERKKHPERFRVKVHERDR